MKRLLPYASPLLHNDIHWNLPIDTLPHLSTLLRRMQLQTHHSLPPDHLNTAPDYVAHVWSQPLSTMDDAHKLDGLLPCLAPELAGLKQSVVEPVRVPLSQRAPGQAACLTPVHALVSTDGIRFADPCSVPFSSDDAQVLFQAIAPIYESEGVELTYVSPWNWEVAHSSLAGIALPSLERVLGESVQHWQSSNPLQPLRLLRRLQSEAQMILHTHPLNQAREDQGLPSINSLWLGPLKVADGLDFEIDWCLREPCLQGDAHAWAQAWRAFDTRLAPLPAYLNQPHPPVIELAFAHSTGYSIWSTAHSTRKGWLQSVSSFLGRWRQHPADIQSLLNLS